MAECEYTIAVDSAKSLAVCIGLLGVVPGQHAAMASIHQERHANGTTVAAYLGQGTYWLHFEAKNAAGKLDPPRERGPKQQFIAATPSVTGLYQAMAPLLSRLCCSNCRVRPSLSPGHRHISTDHRRYTCISIPQERVSGQF